MSDFELTEISSENSPLLLCSIYCAGLDDTISWILPMKSNEKQFHYIFHLIKCMKSPKNPLLHWKEKK